MVVGVGADGGCELVGLIWAAETLLSVKSCISKSISLRGCMKVVSLLSGLVFIVVWGEEEEEKGEEEEGEVALVRRTRDICKPAERRMWA